MTRDCTEENFLKDVSRHQMTIIRDDGVNRHVRFREPGTGIMHFDLITWPNHLCYTGDMGTYVFSRIEDMFQFFRSRTDREHMHLRNGQTLAINPQYWAEKLLAIDSRCGAEEFDPDEFRRVVREQRLEWIREARNDEELDKDARRALWEAIEEEVLSCADEGEHEARRAAIEFSHRTGPHGRHFYFADFWEYKLRNYTHNFIWCCFALAWGIKQYDAAREAQSHDASLALA